jgi:hypothetical protein
MHIPLVYTIHTHTHTSHSTCKFSRKKKKKKKEEEEEFIPEVDDDFGKMKEQRKLKSS